MNDRRAPDWHDEFCAGCSQSPRIEPMVVRLGKWLRRRHRPSEPDDEFDGPDPGLSAA